MVPMRVKMGWLGIVGVDKKQRIVKIQNPLLFEAATAYINVTFFAAKC